MNGGKTVIDDQTAAEDSKDGPGWEEFKRELEATNK